VPTTAESLKRCLRDFIEALPPSFGESNIAFGQYWYDGVLA